MKCPHCGNEINVGALLGSAKSKAKTRAARANAKLGGWPKGKKRGKRKKDANQIAHDVVAKAAEKAAQADYGRPGVPLHYGVTRQGPSPRLLKVLQGPKSPKRGR